MASHLTLHQLCYTSIPPAGLDFYGLSRGFQQLDLVLPHCSYVPPPLPLDRPDQEMPVTFGFRWLDDHWGCLYRVRFPAGRDEVNRPLDFTHTFVVSREDLDLIDCDIPALFTWIEQQGPRGGYLNNATELRQLGNGQPKVELPPLCAPLDVLLAWRAAADARPLSDWFEKSRYSNSMLDDVAQTALRLALAPADFRPPIVWVAPDDGGNGSQQERDVIFFLFAVLPYAWRKSLTFETYRRRPVQGWHAWVGTTNSCLDVISGQYGFQVVNFADPSQSMPLPDLDGRDQDTLTRLARSLHEPLKPTPRSFADHFDVPEEQLFLHGESNALRRIFRARATLAKPSTAALAEFSRMLQDHLRNDRPEFLTAWRSLSHHQKRPLREQPWFAEGMPLVADCLATICQRQVAPLPQKRASELAEDLVDVICHAIEWETVEPVRGLCEQLRRPELSRVWDEVRRRARAELPRLLVRGDRFSAAAPHWIRELLADAADDRGPSQAWEGICETVRQTLCRTKAGLPAELARDAQCLWPFFQTHAPEEAEALTEALRFLTLVARRGPDLTARYVESACARSPAPDRLADDLHQRAATALLPFADTWLEVRGRLPPRLASIPDDLTRAGTVATFWSIKVPSEQVVAKMRQLLPRLTESERRDLAADYLAGGAECLRSGLKALLDHKPEVVTPGLLDVHGQFYALGAQHGGVGQKHATDHLVQVLAAGLSMDPAAFDLQARQALAKHLIGGLKQADVALRWTVYQQIVGPLARALENAKLPSRPPLVDDFRALFAHDPVEAVLVAKCLNPAARGIHDAMALAVIAHPELFVSEPAPPSSAGPGTGESSPPARSPWRSTIRIELERGPLQTRLHQQLVTRLKGADGRGFDQAQCDLWLTPGHPGRRLLKEFETPDFNISRVVKLALGADGTSSAAWRQVARMALAKPGEELTRDIQRTLQKAFVASNLLKEGLPADFADWAELTISLTDREFQCDADLLQRLVGSAAGGLVEDEVPDEAFSRNLASLVEALLSVNRDPLSEKCRWEQVAAVAAWAFQDPRSPPMHVLTRLSEWRGRIENFRRGLCLLGCADLSHDANRSLIRGATRVVHWRTVPAPQDLPDAFGHFLSHCGDPAHDVAEELAQSVSRPRADERGIAGTAVAVGGLLNDAAGLGGEPAWKKLLEELADSPSWEQVCFRRLLGKTESWKAFSAALSRELQGSPVPANVVLGKLRPSRSLLASMQQRAGRLWGWVATPFR